MQIVSNIVKWSFYVTGLAALIFMGAILASYLIIEILILLI